MAKASKTRRRASRTLEKPSRKGYTKIIADRLSEAHIRGEAGDDNNPLHFVVTYIKAGRWLDKKCTPEVYDLVKNAEPKPNRKTGCTFHLSVNPDTKLVEFIDDIAENRYKRGMVPENLQELKELTLVVDAAGNYHLSPDDLPPKLADNSIKQVLSDLDLKEEVEEGDLLGGMPVVEVSGNTITVDMSSAQKRDRQSVAASQL